MRTTLFTIIVFALSFWLISASNSSDPATAFINSLSSEQRATAVLDFNNNTRESWSYLPAAMMPRPGISLLELSNEQRSLAFEVLKSALSETGYTKARNIINLESVLAELDNNYDYRDPLKYHIAFYGDPEKDRIWSWSFEGHHLSLNFTTVGNEVAIAPRFMGASPATIPSGPEKGRRTLAVEADLGLKLVQSLSPDQQKLALINAAPYRDIVSGNAIELEPLKTAGISFDALNPDQQSILLALLSEYISSLPEEQAMAKYTSVQEQANEIFFAWAGDTVEGDPHYYRIQGTTFLVEFDHTVNNPNHVHTVWRDFNGDFGRDLLRQHYRSSPDHE